MKKKTKSLILKQRYCVVVPNIRVYKNKINSTIYSENLHEVLRVGKFWKYLCSDSYFRGLTKY